MRRRVASGAVAAPLPSALLCLVLGLGLACGFAGAARAAGTQAGYDAAIKAAEAAEHQAGLTHDQWTPTVEALKAAHAAAAAKDFAKATELAQHAEALAQLSIAQAQSEQTAWHSAVLR
ncbi:MAG: hypothetical protein KGL12_11370 [Rhodospirillales bacterium]|nr:hypothetical protein [Rhodospirillales bacterium]